MQSRKISKSKKVGFGSKSINIVDVLIVGSIIAVVAVVLLGYINR